MPENTAKPDITLKTYWRRNAEFADLFNAVLFKGDEVIDGTKLDERDTESSVILDEDGHLKGRSSARDIFKIAKEADGVEFALLGLENERGIHYAMPVRDLEYLVRGYRKQYDKIKEKYPKKKGLKPGNEFISHMKRTDKMIPVVNIVLYYGEQPWNGPRTLLEMTDAPDWLRSVAHDYEMNLIEVRDNDLVFHNQNNIDLFSLFKILYDDKKTNTEKCEAAKQYDQEHKVDRTVALAIASMSSIDLNKYAKGEVSVCTLFDEIEKQSELRGEKRGELRGEQRGEKRGEKKGELKVLAGLVRDKILTVEQAAARTSFSVNDFINQCKFYNLTL